MTFVQKSNNIYLPDLNQVKQVFKAIDTDNSGGIDDQELEVAMNKIGMEMSRKMAQSIIQLMDDNNNGVMDFEEFCRFLFVIKNADSSNLASLLFFISDVDYSGEIDAKELSIILNKLGLQTSTKETTKLISLFAGPEKESMTYKQFMSLIEQLTE